MNQRYKKELVNLLVKIKNPKLMSAFITDLLTPVEFEDIVGRWQIIKQLSKGVTQREIAKKLGVSIAKITRGSRELQNPSGGFKKVLKLYGKKNK